MTAVKNPPSEKTAEKIRIRPVDLTGDEAAAFRDLYELSLRHNVEGFVQDVSYHGDIVMRAGLYRQNNGEIFGAFDKEKLIGFGAIRGREPRKAELCNLHLHPDYQGQGIGRRLAEFLVDEAVKRKFDILELHVTHTQKAALGLYVRLGFVQTQRKVYTVMDKDFDTIFMEKRIQP